MPAKIIDGESLALDILEKLRRDVASLKQQGVRVKLAAVTATSDRGAHIYAASQEKSCSDVGIEYELAFLPDNSTEQQIIETIEKYNRDRSISGIILQTPLPPGVDARKLQRMILPAKDVEGMNPANQGSLLYAGTQFRKKPAKGEPGYDNWLEASLGWSLPSPAPCTPIAAMTLIRSCGVDLYGKDAVVIGHSEIVGKPMTLLLLAHFCTVTTCHIATKNLAEHVKRADIVVAAAGVPGLIKGEWIKPGAMVIDVAINRVPALDNDGKQIFTHTGKPKTKIVGDVEFAPAAERAAFITPVPGGVGPMTVAMLLKNTVDATKENSKK